MVKTSFLLFAGGMRGARETRRGKRKEKGKAAQWLSGERSSRASLAMSPWDGLCSCDTSPHCTSHTVTAQSLPRPIQGRCRCFRLVCCSVPCWVPLWKLRVGNSREKKEWLSLVAIASLRTHHSNIITLFLKLYWGLQVKNVMGCSDLAEEIFELKSFSEFPGDLIYFLNFSIFCRTHNFSTRDQWMKKITSCAVLFLRGKLYNYDFDPTIRFGSTKF